MFACIVFFVHAASSISLRKKLRRPFLIHSLSADAELPATAPTQPDAPLTPPAVREEGSPHSPEPDVINLRDFWPYRCLHYVQDRLPFLGTLIRVFLLFIVILQLLFSMLILAFSVYLSANRHSCVGSQKGFFMFLTFFLYFFTRGLLPLVAVCALSSAVLSNLGTQSSSLSSDFLKLISKQDNEPVLQAVVHTFWDVGLAKKTYPKILQELTHHLAKELGVMCVTSTVEAAIVTLILIQVGVTRFALDAYTIPLGGVVEVLIEGLDALSYFALILMMGIISSFFNHEATMNRIVAGAVALEDHADTLNVEPSKELITSAKNTVNNFNYSWSAAEFFIFLSVQLYTFILLLFAGAGLPLSCGITAHVPGEQIHLYWFIFVIVFSTGHFLSTCVWPSAPGATECRFSGILLEALLLAILYSVQPPLFGSFLQILFAVMPASYLFWYLWIKVHYEYSLQSAKPKGWSRQHRRNMGIYICLMAQLVLAITLSIFSEYAIIEATPISTV